MMHQSYVANPNNYPSRDNWVWDFCDVCSACTVASMWEVLLKVIMPLMWWSLE